MSNPIRKLLGQTAVYGLSSIIGRLLNYLLVPLYTSVFIDPSDLRMLLFGLALVLMMLFRPAGLWPSKVRKRELST